MQCKENELVEDELNDEEYDYTNEEYFDDEEEEEYENDYCD